MTVTRVIDSDGRCIEYERRQPEKTVLYRVVQDNIQTLFAEAEARSEHGFGYPNHVKHEFERFLACGILAHGFARIQCGRAGCTFERLVAYSCKGRCICPSCVSRRMADCAAHLTDHVLPKAPYRQWTLSLPYHMRLRVGYDKDLLSEVLSAFLRSIFCWQRLQARRQGIRKPLTGAVTLCQRWGSLLQFSPHFHSWLPDGVFSLDDAGALTFHRLHPPQDVDIVQLLDRIAGRIDTLIESKQHPGVDDEQTTLAQAQATSLQPPVRRDPRDSLLCQSPLCATAGGFSLHAGVSTSARDRAALQRGLRYGLRPPFSHKRLSITPEGKVRLKLRKPTFSGQTELRFDPVDFLRRLAATIPPSRLNMVRFHGLFAPNAKARPAIKALLPSRPAKALSKSSGAQRDQDATQPPVLSQPPAPVPPPYRRRWAELLKRVFDLDILTCGQCGHKMHRISHIEQPDLIEHILGHLGLCSAAPVPAPARAPPQLDLDLDICHDHPGWDLAI